MLENFRCLIEACFWPVVIWAAVGGGLFCFSRPLRENGYWRLLFLMGSVMLCWRLFSPVSSKRYMMPVVMMMLIGGSLAIIWCWRRRNAYKWLLVCGLIGSVLVSVAKIFPGSSRIKDKKILQAAGILRQDFRKNHYRHAVFLADTKEVGRIMFYAGIPGEFVKVTSAEEMQKLILQKNSQADVVYIVNDYRKSISETLKTIHSYSIKPVADSSSGRKEYYLRKVVSQPQIFTGENAIKNYLAQKGEWTNGDFKIPGTQPVSSQAMSESPFLAEKKSLAVPKNWRLDVSHRRGRSFADWRLDYNADGPLQISGAGGFSFRSMERVLPQDKNILFVGEVESKANLNFFLYAYDKKGKLTEVQNIGFLGNPPVEKFAALFEIKAGDLPPGTAFSLVGFISWDGVVKLEKLTVAPVNKVEI